MAPARPEQRARRTENAARPPRTRAQAGAIKNVADKNGQIALHWAALWGRESACKVLIEEGEPIDAEDLDGKTPLMLAEEQKHASVIAMLKGIKAGKRR